VTLILIGVGCLAAATAVVLVVRRMVRQRREINRLRNLHDLYSQHGNGRAHEAISVIEHDYVASQEASWQRRGL
jgi:hypothetical protein